MQLIIYGVLVSLSLSIAWELGNAAHGSTGNLLVFAAIILGANFLLTRRFCFALAAISLLLGFAAPPIIWTYGSLFIKGDTSGYGMLGTLLAFFFIPVGLGLSFVAWRKKK